MATVVGAPAGTSDIAGSFNRAGQGFGSIIAGLAQRQQKQKRQQDLQLLMQTLNPQALEQNAPGVGPPAPQPQIDLSQLSGLQTPGFQNLASQMLMQRANRPQQPDFTLGDTRFSGRTNQPIATNPASAQQRPSAFQEKQSQIDALSAIPLKKRTVEQRAQLNDLVGISQEKTPEEKSLQKAQIEKTQAEANRLLRENKGKLSPEDITSQGNIFRKEFNALSGDFVKSRDAFTRVKASFVDPSAAGDLAMIFNFMKVLDPGSVVRESEFANAAASGAFGERVKGAANKIVNGQRLSDEVRKDFMTRAKLLFKAQQANQSKLTKRYTGLSKRFGIDPQNVIDTTAIDDQRTQALQQGAFGVTGAGINRNTLNVQDLDNMSIEQMQALLQKQ